MKLASLQRAIHASGTPLDATYVNAGQHYDEELAGQYLKGLAVDIDVDLTPRLHSKDPMRRSAEMLVELNAAFASGEAGGPDDPVVVVGDANTTLAAAIAAAKAGRRIAHVEAGVRLPGLPTSEEVNRRVADRLASKHFVSSRRDMAHLEAEGVRGATFTGDVVRDLVADLEGLLPQEFRGRRAGSYVLVTMHRKENLDVPERLVTLLGELARRRYSVILVTHPRTREVLRDGGWKDSGLLEVLPGLPYLESLTAIARCRFLITDSGALQRESFYLGRRALVRQDAVFWSSLTRAGFHRQMGTDAEDVESGLAWMERELGRALPILDDFGSGDAGTRILNGLVDW